MLSRGRVPGTPRHPSPRPGYLPLRCLQLRGQCGRLRLTRGAPPRPPSAQRRGGADPAGGGTGRGRPLAPPAHRPAGGHSCWPPPLAGGRGLGCRAGWGVGGGWAPSRTQSLLRLPAPRGGPASGKLRGTRGGVGKGRCCPPVANRPPAPTRPGTSREGGCGRRPPSSRKILRSKCRSTSRPNLEDLSHPLRPRSPFHFTMPVLPPAWSFHESNYCGPLKGRSLKPFLIPSWEVSFHPHWIISVPLGTLPRSIMSPWVFTCTGISFPVEVAEKVGR